MSPMVRKALFLLTVFLTLAADAGAQLISWNPSTLSGTFGPSPWTPSVLNSALTSPTAGLVRGSSIATSGSPAGGCYGGSGGWLTGGGDANSFYFTITASCHKVSLSSIAGFTRRSSSGPTGCNIYYSLNGGSYILVGSWTTSSTSGTSGTSGSTVLSSVTALQNIEPGTSIKFKITPSGTSGNWYFTNTSLALNGTVVAVTAPAITTSPSPSSIPVTTGTSFTVSGVTGASSYQWQRNTSGISGGTWVNITSATMDPTGTYSGFAGSSTATSNTLTLNDVPASWDGYGYRVVVTNCAGTATSDPALLNVIAGSCSGTPAGGTAVASPASFCGSGSSTISLTGGSAVAGLTYQWQSSSSGSIGTYSDIIGATTTSYTTSSLTATTYYRLVTTCTSSLLSDTSTVATVTINPVPAVAVTPSGGSICSGAGGLTMTASGADTYTWLPATGLSATTGASVTAAPSATTVFTVTGSSSAGCTATATATVTYALAPSALSVTPSSATQCLGAAPLLLAATGGVVGPQEYNSGTVTIPSSIAAFGTIASSISVSGIPAGAVITGAAVNVISFGSQYQDDYIVNIKAPNGNVLNLIRQRGTHTSTVTTLFSNTNISSTGTASLASGSGTYTGTWMADAVSGVSTAPYTSNVTGWSGLYSVPNGTWTLSIFNNTSFSNTVVPSAQWSITLYYQAPVTWLAATDLYADATGAVPYTGEVTPSVYFDPSVAGVISYTATAANGICTTNATTTVTVDPAPESVTGGLAVCEGLTTTLANATTGGTWASTTPGIATVDAFGIVTGIATGTAAVTYTMPTGCFAVAVVTVNELPSAITGTLTLCETGATTLSSATSGGTWASGAAAIASVDASGVVAGLAAGTAGVTYTSTSGCSTTTIVTVNSNPAPITGALAICEGLMTTLSSATAGGTWVSSSVGTATVDAVGTVTGVTTGTTMISYTIPVGCFVAAEVTVNALPAAIAGTLEVCQLSATALASTTAGGTWSSSNTALAGVDAAGIVTGVSAGIATITYALGTGCIALAVVTVNPLPDAVTGALGVCEGLTTALSSATVGGTWLSSAASVAGVDVSGIVTGVSAGTTAISYVLSTGCFSSAEVTVNPLPAAITGTTVVCVDATTTLANADAGGTWASSNIAVATINASGVVTGVGAGTAIITYTLATGCGSTVVVTVNPLPAALMGDLAICEGLTTTLSSASAGGTWGSSMPGIADVDAFGVVTAVAHGTAVITYTISTGCFVSEAITVNSLPAAISGTPEVCEAATTTLANSTPGGTWSSSLVATATVDAGGVVAGVAAGTAIITYELGTGCITAAVITVHPVPAAITGAAELCEGFITTVASATPGGAWTSGTTAVATVDATGAVAGIVAGTSVITYTAPTGCFTIAIITVNPVPAAITGALEVCESGATNLVSATVGGSWATDDIATATVDLSGAVSGVAPGTTTISYTMLTGCAATAVITVNPLPAGITGTLTVCEGLTTTLTSATAGGTWASDPAAIAAVDVSGIVGGVSAGTSAITYTIPTGCFVTATVTVNPLPGAITGTPVVCTGATTTLSNAAAGGTWTIGSANATVDASGNVTGINAGTAVVTYTVATGCIATAVITVNESPATITGIASVCQGLTTTFSNTTPSGTWMSGSANATVGATTGIVVGIAAGTAVVTYTGPNSCIAIRTVTVDPLPGTITGTATVCVGSTTTLVNTAGGTWGTASFNASVGATTGIVTGLIAGTATITYTLSTGCITTRVVTINPLPAAIGGTGVVCVAGTATLSNTGGGTWTTTSLNASVAFTTGIVTGINAGTARISYTLPSGCFNTRIVTVNPLPATISGAASVCIGAATTLSSPGGGTWASSSSGVATVGAATGVVSGITVGTTTITYTLPTGCATTRIVTVNPLPSAISGSLAVCVASATTLTNTGGGTWTSSNANATIGLSTGIASGVSAGTAIITYTLSTGCISTAMLTINALPVPYAFTGGGSYCAGGSGVTLGLAGSDAGISYQVYFGSSVSGSPAVGTGAAIDLGVFTLAGTYSVLATNAATGCTGGMIGFATVSINPLLTPEVTITSVAPTLCSGAAATFNATPVNGGTAPAYQWMVNGAPVGSSAPSYTYVPAHGDIVSVKLTSNAVCATPDTAIATDTLTVLPTGLPSITFTTAPGTHVCEGTAVTFTAVTTLPGSSGWVRWTQNGINVATGPTYTYTPANGDAVYAVLFSDYACRLADSVASATVTITVEAAGPAPVVSISASPGLFIAAGEPVVFVATVAGGGAAPSYQWLINGVAVPGASSATFTTSMLEHNDLITCNVTGSGMCGLMSFNTVQVSVSAAAVNDLSAESSLSIQPNPSTGRFSIIGTWPGAEELMIEVINMLGETVVADHATIFKGVLNYSIALPDATPAGHYMLRLHSPIGNKVSHLIIKK